MPNSLPWQPRIPASSNCVTYSSEELFGPTSTVSYFSYSSRSTDVILKFHSLRRRHHLRLLVAPPPALAPKLLQALQRQRAVLRQMALSDRSSAQDCSHCLVRLLCWCKVLMLVFPLVIVRYTDRVCCWITISFLLHLGFQDALWRCFNDGFKKTIIVRFIYLPTHTRHLFLYHSIWTLIIFISTDGFAQILYPVLTVFIHSFFALFPTQKSVVDVICDRLAPTLHMIESECCLAKI